MRFTLSGFIVSTVALLSLITPVINAGPAPSPPAVITSPKAGVILNLLFNKSVDVECYVVKGENPSAVVLS